MLGDVGTLLAGAALVPIYSSNTAEQCAFIIRDAGARLVIVEDDVQREKIQSVLASLPEGIRIVQIDPRAPGAAAGGGGGAPPPPAPPPPPAAGGGGGEEEEDAAPAARGA